MFLVFFFLIFYKIAFFFFFLFFRDFFGQHHHQNGHDLFSITTQPKAQKRRCLPRTLTFFARPFTNQALDLFLTQMEMCSVIQCVYNGKTIFWENLGWKIQINPNFSGSSNGGDGPANGGPLPPPAVGEEVLLCKVCSDRASGFHYGIFSCEGCKASF